MEPKAALRLVRPVAVVAVVAALSIGFALPGHNDWNVALLIFLTAAAAAADRFPIDADGFYLTGAFLSITLCAILLGPGPGVVAGFAATVIYYAGDRPDRTLIAYDLPAYTLFPLLVGIGYHALEPHASGQALRAVLVAALYAGALIFAYVVIGVLKGLVDREPLIYKLRTHLEPMGSGEALCAALTALAVILHNEVGNAGLALTVVTMLIFQWLTRELVLSRDRAIKAERVGRAQVVTIIRVLDMRDEHTARHSAAVATYVYETARMLPELTESDRRRLQLAAALHDVGKVAVPDAILHKPGPLEDDEKQQMRRHPYQGSKIIERLEDYSDLAAIVVAHHERPDGTGYPRGLRGDDIPLGAKLIAIADTYDVITARTVYSEPRSHEVAVAILKEVAGSQLDAPLVTTFVRMLTQTGLRFEHTTAEGFEQLLNDLLKGTQPERLAIRKRLRRRLPRLARRQLEVAPSLTQTQLAADRRH